MPWNQVGMHAEPAKPRECFSRCDQGEDTWTHFAPARTDKVRDGESTPPSLLAVLLPAFGEDERRNEEARDHNKRTMDSALFHLRPLLESQNAHAETERSQSPPLPAGALVLAENALEKWTRRQFRSRAAGSQLPRLASQVPSRSCCCSSWVSAATSGGGRGRRRRFA